MLTGHGGNLSAFIRIHSLDIDPSSVTDFSVSTNPFDYPPGFIEYLASELSGISRYPEVQSETFTAAVTAHHSLCSGNVLAGNGSTELLYLIPRAFAIRKAVVAAPSYIDYEDAVTIAGGECQRLFLHWENDFAVNYGEIDRLAATADAVILAHPNNPNGRLLDVTAVWPLMQKHTDVLFVIDEAYLPLSGAGSEHSFITSPPEPNVIVLRSMTKSFSIPGLRLGYAVGTASVIEKLIRYKEPWTVNSLAQKAGIFLLPCTDWLKMTTGVIADERTRLTEALSHISGLTPFMSDTNFFLLKIVRDGLTALELQLELVKHDCFIRNCDNYPGLDSSYFRIAVRKPDENTRFIETLESLLKHYIPSP